MVEKVDLKTALYQSQNNAVSTIEGQADRRRQHFGAYFKEELDKILDRDPGSPTKSFEDMNNSEAKDYATNVSLRDYMN